MSDYQSQPLPVAEQAPRNGLGNGAMVLGAMGVLSGLIAVFWIAWVLGIAGALGVVGLFLGLAGYARFQRGEATNGTIALWGIFISVFAVILSIVGVVILVGASVDLDGDPTVETEGTVSPTAEKTVSPRVETFAPVQAEPTAPTEPEEVDVVGLKVRDCLAEIEETEESFTSVETVPCAEPHSEEIFAIANIPEGDGQFPGWDAILEHAERLCTAEFESFVGRSYEESELEFSFILPDEEGWRTGDRLIQCTIYDPPGNTTGTLAGANR